MTKIEQLRKAYRHIRLAQLELEQSGYGGIVKQLNKPLEAIAKNGRELKERENDVLSATQ